MLFVGLEEKTQRHQQERLHFRWQKQTCTFSISWIWIESWTHWQQCRIFSMQMCTPFVVSAGSSGVLLPQPRSGQGTSLLRSIWEIRHGLVTIPLLLLSRLVKSGCPLIVSEPGCMVFSINASNVAKALLFIYIICSVRSPTCILFMKISPRIHTAIHVSST